MGVAAPAIAAISALATVGSAITGVVGAEQSASAQAAAANYQAQIAANNAIVQQQNAAAATQTGEAQASAQAMKARQQAGAIKAGEAASGVVVDSGSAADVQTSQAELSDLDALTIRSNYARSAYGYEVAATGQTAQSQLDIAAADNASAAGGINATTSLLSGATSLGTQYARWQQAAGTTTQASFF